MFFNKCKHNWAVVKSTYQEPWYQEEDIGDVDIHYVMVRQGGDTTTFLLQCQKPNCGATRTEELDGKEYNGVIKTLEDIEVLPKGSKY